MRKLDPESLSERIKFIEQYIHAENAATGSKLDANANVSSKNIATLEAELNKDINIQVNRELIKNRIRQKYDHLLAEQYEKDIESHLIYVHDETSLKPYCVSIDMTPFIQHGMKGLGGESTAPKNLNSFCGSFINLVFAIASQFAGAVATTQFLTCMEYYVRKEFGEDWYVSLSDQNKKTIQQCFQQIVYSINQPAAARGYQAVFWNISIFDREYFEAIMKHTILPDFEEPSWDGVSALQQMFLEWFRQERSHAELTFPVITAALLTNDNKVSDQQTVDVIANEFAEGNTMFVYLSDTPDSLASCCRLRNEISKEDFSYSLGAGGVKTGSINVITLNVNRLVQQQHDLTEVVSRIHKYHLVYREIIKDYIDNNMLPVYTEGFIDLDKQFCTIGINGFVEAAEYRGISITPNQEYFSFAKQILNHIYQLNRAITKETGIKFNTEFVPAENLGVKNAKWDKQDGLAVQRDCYNSYFYVVENDTNMFDKFILHGKDINVYLDGGSALHLNIDVPMDKETFKGLFNVAAVAGCNYFTVNIPRTPCDTCGYIEKRPVSHCPMCGSVTPDRITRVIGYAKRVSSWSAPRQQEHSTRFYHNSDKSTLTT